MRRRITTTFAAVGAAVLAAAGGLIATALPASAADTAQVLVTDGVLTFRGGGTAVNDLLLFPHGVGFVLRERGSATLTLDPAGNGPCLQQGSREVFCNTRAMSLHVELGAGNDKYDDWGGADLPVFLLGGDGNDVVRSGSGADTLHGGDGHDDLYGGLGPDVVYGGNHNDSLWGMAGNDTLDGQAGTDDLHGDDNDDVLLNSARDRDSMYGGTGNDRITNGDHNYGEDGDDTFLVQKGFGDFWGGAGTDTIDYAPWPYARVVVSLDGNDNDWNGECGGCPYADRPGRHNVHGDFEVVLGTSGEDTIRGNNEPDRLDGRGGNDYLFGNGGDDTLDAGPGTNQQTHGGDGTDTCRGDNLSRVSGCDNV
jgi:Ca2+-binding RTX toxin-like protein